MDKITAFVRRLFVPSVALPFGSILHQFLVLLFLSVVLTPLSRAQQTADAPQPPDLKMELRSATGATRFQVGEVIPLELAFSSSTTGRYLEPCMFLTRRCFGYPICRFPNSWKWTITSDAAWVDFDKRCGTMSGPTYVVEDHDLTAQSKVIPYELTSRYRFDTPGEYTVRFTTDIGLDDESNPRPELFKATKEPSDRHSVSATAEFHFTIVPADPSWQDKVIRQGYDAYSRPEPRNTDPPSPELIQYQKDATALCRLGSRDAARALVRLLLEGHSSVISCLYRLPSWSAAVHEMQRLLTDPDTAISTEFFNELVILQNRQNRQDSPFMVMDSSDVDRVRERLIAALPQKRGNAFVTSLLTVLRNPAFSNNATYGSNHLLRFPDPVIALAAKNFEQFPVEWQNWLLEKGQDSWSRPRGWESINSPLMLPVLRRLAEKGNGRALLRWQELDPASANAFETTEILRTTPQFSSFYLRLPQPLPAKEEKRLAANFVAQAQLYDGAPGNARDNLTRLASLLHRYGTRAVLPTVSPVIETRRSTWPCTIEVPVLAYLLKVSSDQARPAVEAALSEANHGPCNTSTFFTDFGSLQPSPILEQMAFAQLEAKPGPFARDAAEYLRSHASPDSKERLWKALLNLQHYSTNSLKGKDEQKLTAEEAELKYSVRALAESFIEAQGWLLTPDDERALATVLGSKEVEAVACSFSCGTKLSISEPGDFGIRHALSEPKSGRSDIVDYLNPQGQYRYAIRQYRCPNMQALKEKLLQFPAGSRFSFGDFSELDRNELVEISDFLWSHGYRVRNHQKWDFLRQDETN